MNVSLRARLVLVVIVLLGAGLMGSALATSTLLRSYLYDQVDTRLATTSQIASRLLLNPPPTAPIAPPTGLPTRGEFSDVQAARIDSDGKIVSTLVSPFTSRATTAFAAVPASTLQRARTGQSVTLNVNADGRHFRAIIQPLPGTSDVAVVLTPLREVEATLTRLYRIELAATVLLVVCAIGSASWLVRVGMRPLRDMADTADAIASGEIDRRIEVGGGAEVERLGQALNKAFDARAASEQTLRAFIADASHELRTPLTAIRGYAQLLQAGAFDTAAERERAVSRIEAEAARTGVLVDDLLALARLDEGRPLTFEPVDIVKVAADAVHDAKAVDPDRRISLVAPEPVEVIADESGIRRVLTNLLDNARIHTGPEQGIEVAVHTTVDGVRLDVVDDGSGVPPADRPHVFDRFWRGQVDRRSRDDKGSGLGLAIVAAVAAAHGGRAYLEDDPAHGAHFVVTFPFGPSTAREEEFTSASQAPAKVR